MSNADVRLYATPALQALQWARNGRYPDAHMARDLAGELNHCAGVRLKQLASFTGLLSAIPTASSALRDRWRFYGHVSPFTDYVFVEMLMFQRVPDASGDAMAGRFLLETTGGVTVGDARFNYGNTATSPTDCPNTIGSGGGVVSSGGFAIAVTPDTDYVGTFSDLNSGRLIAASVYEVSFSVDTADGYIPGSFAQSTPIFDEDRRAALELARSLYKRQAGPLWNWSSDQATDAATNATNTAKNIIDGTSTAPSASTPGATLDLRYRTTASRASTGVPCVFAAYAGGGGATTAVVELVNSAGTVVASITGYSALGANWRTTTVNLPATLAKYDIRIRNGGGGTATLYATSLFQYIA